MFNVGTAELLVILLVALLVLGPNKLPDAARQVGRALGELRRLSSGFQAEMRDALREPVEGTPAPDAPTTPASPGSALSSPKSSGSDAGTIAAPALTDGAGTTEAPVSHAVPTGADSERGDDSVGDDSVGGDGGDGGDLGDGGARVGRGGTSASSPGHDTGSNGSAPT